MINPTRVIEMTVTKYVPQFRVKPYKYYNTDFYVFQESFKKMYLNNYAGAYHQSALSPFKVVML